MIRNLLSIMSIFKPLESTQNSLSSSSSSSLPSSSPPSTSSLNEYNRYYFYFYAKLLYRYLLSRYHTQRKANRRFQILINLFDQLTTIFRLEQIMLTHIDHRLVPHIITEVYNLQNYSN